MLDEKLLAHLGPVPKLSLGRLLASPQKANLFDVATYRKALSIARARIVDETAQPEVHKLYQEKLDELALRGDLIEAVQKKDDARVTALSLQLYGNPTFTADELGKEFAEHLTRAEAKEIHHHAPRITSEAFVDLARQRLADYGITNWRVRRSSHSWMQTGHAKMSQSPLLRVPKNLHVTRARAERLLAHEIDVHILRAVNGSASDLQLLGRGLAGYTKHEEGLALYLQHLSDRVERKIRPGFWQAWTIALLREAGYDEARRTLGEAREKLYQAMDVAEPKQRAEEVVDHLLARSLRGISKPGPAGIFFARDHVYRTGYDQIAAFATAHGNDALKDLFVGKITLEHLPIIKKLNLVPSRLPQSLK